MSSNTKIMVVDDDVTLRIVSCRLLQTAGYEVLCAVDGEEAVQMTHIHQPDLILMDMSMPKMGGFEAMRRIKSDANLAATFVVIVSGSRVDTDSQVHGLDTGADGYITRPIPKRELLARVQAVLRIKAAESAVRCKEKQLRELVASSIDGMLVLDHDGYALFANLTVCELLDRTNQAIEGQLIGIPLVVEEFTELELLRPDGARRTVEMHVREMEWEDQPVYLATFHDITHRKRIEEEIRQINSKLEARVAARTLELQQAQEKLIRQERLAVLGQLAGGVGHELRNPLSVMTIAVYFLQILLPNVESKVQEYLGIIGKELHTAEKIITDLLDFARVQGTGQSLLQGTERQLFSIPDAVSVVLERYSAPPSVKVILDLPPSMPPAFADFQQVEQVLGNLVLNAYQAIPTGGTLTISAVQRDHEIIIAIQDTGGGIPPVIIRKLFDSLFTTKPKGIGLGLVICKNLIEANAGRIEVESQVEQGATFRVVLPAHKEA